MCCFCVLGAAQRVRVLAASAFFPLIILADSTRLTDPISSVVAVWHHVELIFADDDCIRVRQTEDLNYLVTPWYYIRAGEAASTCMTFSVHVRVRWAVYTLSATDVVLPFVTRPSIAVREACHCRYGAGNRDNEEESVNLFWCHVVFCRSSVDLL